jgi:hypothetical protein
VCYDYHLRIIVVLCIGPSLTLWMFCVCVCACVRRNERNCDRLFLRQAKMDTRAAAARLRRTWTG